MDEFGAPLDTTTNDYSVTVEFGDGTDWTGTGEVDFRHLFETLDRLGYDGWVGAEYVPSGPTEETLAWFEPYRRAES